MSEKPAFELSGHPYIELLSAAFQIPSFLIVKVHVEANRYEGLTRTIYERILTNWLAEDRELIIAYDVGHLRDAFDFLSALAASMRGNLYRFRKVGKPTGYSMQRHSRWVTDLHRNIMSEWLEISPITTITLLGTRWHQRLQEEMQHGCIDPSISNEDIDERSASAWSLIWTDAQGASFREIYAQTITTAVRCC